VLRRQYKHEALVYNIFILSGQVCIMWDSVIVSVWGTSMNCEGKRNFGDDSRGGVSWKYQEVLERRKRAILSQ
jgi:hypothetical protein